MKGYTYINLKINTNILNRITAIDKFKSKWKTLKNATRYYCLPKKVATIESIWSSKRIEGNKLSDKEILTLLTNIKTTPFKNRDEKEVAGYAELSNIIFDNYEIIPLTENYTKQMHSQFLKHSKKINVIDTNVKLYLIPYLPLKK